MNALKRSICSGLLLAACAVSHSLFASDLIEVYRVAETNDTLVRQAQAALHAAEQRREQSRGQLLPKADFSADASRSEQKFGNNTSSSSTWGYSLSISQPIYNRSNYDLLKQSDKLKSKALADYDAAKQNLIVRIAESYFNVLAAQDSLDFAESEIEANARQLEQSKQRFEVGLIAITDVHEAQAAYDLAVARKIVVKNELASSIEALREQTGEYHDNFKRLATDVPLAEPTPADPNAWVELALKNNLRIIASRLALESSRALIRQQQSGHLPTVDLIGQHNYIDDTGIRFNNASSTNTSLILQMNVSLYRGGSTQAKIKEAEQLYNQKLAELEQIRRNVQRQTRDAYSNVLAFISQVAALNQGIISTQSALEASQAGLEVGTRTTVDVLNTRRELFRALRDHARARYDYFLSTLKLKEATGSLSVDDLLHINTLLQQ